MSDVNFDYAQDYERHLINTHQYYDDDDEDMGECCYTCTSWNECECGCGFGICEYHNDWHEYDDDACGQYILEERLSERRKE